MIRAVIEPLHHDRKARTAIDRAIHATVDAVINGGPRVPLHATASTRGADKGQGGPCGAE
jgi:hypothetical protein